MMGGAVVRWGAGRLECTWAILAPGDGAVIGDRRRFHSFVVMMGTNSPVC